MSEFEFDFVKGDFTIVDGKARKISGVEMLKNKIEKLLRTEFEKYPVYDQYGMPFYGWFAGQRDRDLIKIAMTREITERVPEYIEGVRQVFDFNFEFEHRGCRVNFKVKTDYSDNEEMISQWIAF